jgi:hypothetical protein
LPFSLDLAPTDHEGIPQHRVSLNIFAASQRQQLAFKAMIKLLASVVA